MDSIIIPLEDLIDRVTEMEDHSMDFVEIKLQEADEDEPAHVVIRGHRLDVPGGVFLYDDIEAAELPNEIIYVDAEVVDPEALPSPMLPD